MYVPLSKLELCCLEAIFNGDPLSSIGDGSAGSSSSIRRAFNNACSKMRSGTGYYQMPEHALECDYSLTWFKAHPQAGRALVERYQKAAAEAGRVFWQARGGVAKPDENSDWGSDLDD